MVLKLFTNHFSQPARAVTLFVRASQIPAEEIFVAIDQGEQNTEEFGKVNKFRKVPAIVHDDYHLSESVAIMCYLAREFNVAQHWYPTEDNKAMGRIDQFLGWQHLQLRAPLDRYLLSYIYPDWHVITDYPIPPSQTQIELNRKNMASALDNFVKMWLCNGTKFVCGNEISIADLLAAAEIDMMRLTDYDVREGRAQLGEYLDRVRSATIPHYDQVNAVIFKANQK